MSLIEEILKNKKQVFKKQKSRVLFQEIINPSYRGLEENSTTGEKPAS